MLVSDQARALGAARGARALSCYMRKQLASAPQRVPRDAHVENEPDMATLRGPGPRPWRGSAGAGLQEVCRRSAGGGLLESQLAEASGSRAAAFIALFATYYRSDLIAHDMESLREAVEELNGVSFRDS